MRTKASLKNKLIQAYLISLLIQEKMIKLEGMELDKQMKKTEKLLEEIAKKIEEIDL